MGLPVLVIGESGSGKTYSLKNFEPNEVSIFSVEKARLPFQKKLPLLAHAKYADIEKVLKSPNKKSYVIDDSQYLLVNELFDRSAEKGYDKYTQMAANFRNLIHSINELPEDDKIVYFLHHTETGPDGREKAKTIGKMLDEKLTVEGCFDIVLFCQDHKFYTQSNGMSTAKRPEGMLELEMVNDLKQVDDAIRDYWGLH